MVRAASVFLLVAFVFGIAFGASNKKLSFKRVGSAASKVEMAENTPFWTADFSAEGITKWLAWQSDAGQVSIASVDDNLVMTAMANSWDAGAVYPDVSQVPRVEVKELANGKLHYKVISKTSGLTYDIALDEFNGDGTYINTKWNVVPHPAKVGSGSVNLTGITYDPGTVYVMPKINIHTTATNQSLTVAILSFSAGKEEAASKSAKIEMTEMKIAEKTVKAEKAKKSAIWSADFSPEGIEDWRVYGEGAAVNSTDDKLVISVSLNSWDAGGAYPNAATVTQAPASSAKNLYYNIASRTEALNYDIALDEFDSEGVYVNTKWNVVAYPGPVGPNSISLKGIKYDANTVYILPKINVHTTATNQSLVINSLSFD
ncbi:MAG: hypothetical protein ABII64_00715 [Elusimicrobiota bacterium]